MNNRHSRSKTWTASCTAIQHFYCLYDFVPFGLRWIQANKQRKSLSIFKRPCCGTFCHYGTFCHLTKHQIWCAACTFCHCGTFCQYVVTKRAERSTRCTFCHSFASSTIIYLSLPSCAHPVCARAQVCLRARARVCVCVGGWMGGWVCVCVRVCWCAFVRDSARARLCVVVYCVVFIIPVSISAKLKFVIALSRPRGYCCP